MWYVGVEGRKIKAVKMYGSFGCINFFKFFKDLHVQSGLGQIPVYFLFTCDFRSSFG